jgi:hypothetical protein
MTFSIMTFSLMIFSIMTFSITALSITALSITALSIKGLFATFGVTALFHYAGSLDAECRVLFIDMLNAIMPNDVMLNLTMLTAVGPCHVLTI